MSSYYDNELVSHMKTIKIGDVTIISQIDNITELMMENFQFKNGRVCFTEKQNGGERPAVKMVGQTTRLEGDDHMVSKGNGN